MNNTPMPARPAAGAATPGPWRVAKACRFLVTCGAPRTEPGTSCAGIATTSRDEMPWRFLDEQRHLSKKEYDESERRGWGEARQAEMAANARLIASSPELFAALEQSLALLEKTMDVENHPVMNDADYLPVIAQARAAIAKAQPETPHAQP